MHKNVKQSPRVSYFSGGDIVSLKRNTLIVMQANDYQNSHLWYDGQD